MGEIGSEFWDVPTNKEGLSFFLEQTQWFLSGRSALKAIIKELKGCQSIALPSWCCDSMIKPFEDSGIEVYFYSVYYDNEVVQRLRFDCDALFLMDYFGYTGLQLDLSDYDGVVIRDVTHSIFSYQYNDADYYFGSLRKWCGIWTGGYAWEKNGLKFNVSDEYDKGYTVLRQRAMQLKKDYINGQSVDDKCYLKIFNEAEELLDDVDVVSATEHDVKIAQILDVQKIITKRRANAEILRRAFSEWLAFPDMKDTDCPMFVPILVPNGKRDELRKFLIQNEIYCPVHWPVSEHHKLGKKEQFIYDNELSLVCDQRYTEEDMNRIVDVITTFWKGR